MNKEPFIPGQTLILPDGKSGQYLFTDDYYREPSDPSVGIFGEYQYCVIAVDVDGEIDYFDANECKVLQ